MIQQKIPIQYINKYTKKRYAELEEDKKHLQLILIQHKIILKNKKILDLAAGPGSYEQIFDILQAKQVDYTDKTEDYIILAKKEHKKRKLQTKINYFQMDLMGIKKLKPDSYDFILCNMSFYYAKNESLFLKYIQRILKSKGKFYLVIHGKEYLKNLSPLQRFITKTIYAINQLSPIKLAPTPYHNIPTLLKIIKKRKLKIIYLQKRKDNMIDLILEK